MAPHRDDLEAAQQRILALQDRVDELEAHRPEPPLDDKPPLPPREQPKRGGPSGKEIAEMEAAGLAQAAQFQADTATIVAKAQRKGRDGLIVVFGTTVLLAGFWVADYLLATRVDPARQAAGQRVLFANEAVMFGAAVTATVTSFALLRIYAPARLMHRLDDPNWEKPRLSRAVWGAMACVAFIAHGLVLVLGSR